MQLIRNQFSERLNAFNVLTRGFLHNEKDDETKEFLKRVIITGHNLVINAIEDKDIDFDIYDIVTLIVSTDRPYMRDYLKHIDPKNVHEEDYQSLNNVLTSLISDNSNEL